MAEGRRDGGWVTRFTAFVAIILVAASLILAKVLSGEIVGALELVANILALFVVAVCSFFYAYGKLGKGKSKNIWYIIAWAAAVIIVIIVYVI